MAAGAARLARPEVVRVFAIFCFHLLQMGWRQMLLLVVKQMHHEPHQAGHVAPGGALSNKATLDRSRFLPSIDLGRLDPPPKPTPGGLSPGRAHKKTLQSNWENFHGSDNDFALSL